MQLSARRLFDNLQRTQAENAALRAGKSVEKLQPAEP